MVMPTFQWGDYRTGHFGDATGSLWRRGRDLYLNSLDDLDVGTNWATIYKAINDCNLILKYVPDISFSMQIQKLYIGSAIS